MSFSDVGIPLLTRMAELQKWVQEFRDDDEKVDKKNQKYALKVIQEKNKKKIDKKQPKKKRSRKEPPKGFSKEATQDRPT